MHADAKILTAAAKNINPKAPFMILFEFLGSVEVDKALETPINTPHIDANANMLGAIFSVSIFDIFFNADDNIKIEIARGISDLAVFCSPFESPVTFLNAANEPMSSVNSPVMAPIANDNFSGFIVASKNKLPARIAIDIAIFFKVFAWISF